MITDTLESRIYSSFPIIKIDTDEEPRLLAQLRGIAEDANKNLITWSIASGYQELIRSRADFAHISSWTLKKSGDYSSEDFDTDNNKAKNPETFLEIISEKTTNSIIVLLDFHPYFEKSRVVRLLKEFAFTCEKNKNKVVLLSHSTTVPSELAGLTQAFEVNLPTLHEIAKLVDQEAALFKITRKNKTLKIDETAKSLLVSNLVGVNTSDALRLIRNAIYMDNAITASDVPEIKKAKYDLISNSGALTFEYDTSSFSEIGGFSNLKNWVDKRKHAILAKSDDPKKTKDRPKGILLLGVQGCGKSLAARALSGQLGVPLIRLDFSSLFNKYIGESEKNIREALRSAEVMSPCVLWIDELEKGVSGVGDDNTGASTRILSYLLNWMQENKSGTFVVATANDISSLPPELIRKGRIDEIFFVDLPTHKIRMDIVRTALLKRGLEPEAFAIDRIAAASEGFSGAEIEQAIVSSLYHTSVVRAESIAELRRWASERTVPVDPPEKLGQRAA